MRNNVNSPWTDQRVIDLVQFLGKGLTYSEIAGRIGCGVTRCAVSGKINRLGLVSYSNNHGGGTRRTPEEIEITKQLQNERRRARRRALCFISGTGPTMRVDIPRPARPTHCEEITPRHLTLLELEPHHCRWPYGNKPYTFCGLDQYEGSSYCLYHCLANSRSINRD